jgi:hypothetical protein
MGLDIFFHKTKRSNWNKIKKEIDAFNALSEEEQSKRYDERTHPTANFEPEEIGYFRKVNFLMEFFHYEGNCEHKEISKDELEELRNACIEIGRMKPCKVEYVKATSQWDKDRVVNVYSEADQKRCSELLPTQSGFFFGSTDYDEWYFRDVKEVLAWVDGVLDNLGDKEVVLMYCWW